MKRITLFILLITITGGIAQVTNEGEPMSWKRTGLNTTTPVLMESIDLEALAREDAVNDSKRGTPWRFGKELPVYLNMDNSGVWDILGNGDRIWRLNIVAEGARTLNFVFDNFYLPEGATLYFYNDDRTDLLGAYTASQNREDRQLGTWFVDGDNVWLEYYEPESQAGEGVLNITKVVHGYRSVSQNMTERNLNDSGACNLDVDCSIGTDFDDKKDILKRSVALFLVGGTVCSGTLINNTENNNAPYFLTANHCDNGNTGIWAFRFNWVSPNPSCATFTNSTNGSYNETASGATKLAANAKSDFMLVNIDASLPTFWNLAWAGWNRSATVVPQYTVGIHHPNGDIMKVCRANIPPQRMVAGNTDIWYIDHWSMGVTEPGSSGSALFDQNGRIIGQLYAGLAECSGTSNNGEYDIYGRLDTSWDFGASSASRLSDWLDPQGTGVTTTDILNTPDFQYLGNIRIFPNPASSQLYIENNNSSGLSYQLYSVTGKLIKQDALPLVNNAINIENFAEGMYFLKLTDELNNSSVVKRIAVKK